MSSSLTEFLITDDWDAPFFKRLANNDTAAARGHQGGMVVTQDLRQFFPFLQGRTSAIIPTIDRTIWADMFIGLKQIAHGMVRYQIQTWGGTRSPESRITEGFAPLHRRAVGGDILVFQRRSDSIEHFRLVLIKRGTRTFREIENVIGSRTRGVVYENQQPVTAPELETAANEMDGLADQDFVLIQSIRRVESRQLRIARSSIFPLLVRQEYSFCCCVSDVEMQTPTHIHEVQAAHVVPVTAGGIDDIRNGLSLSRSLHWAFDRGLFGIKADRTVYIPPQVRRIDRNSFLRQFAGKTIAMPRTAKFRVHEEALRWHRDNIVSKWE
jgi:putative restriction endonuclease